MHIITLNGIIKRSCGRLPSRYPLVLFIWKMRRHGLMRLLFIKLPSQWAALKLHCAIVAFHFKARILWYAALCKLDVSSAIRGTR